MLIKYKNGDPKAAAGSCKVRISLLPAVAIINGAHALQDGARKYGPYNWRDTKVNATVYLNALFRHVLAWQDGEELAEDSGVHHLGHAIGCCAILLDAQANDNLIDDRPKSRKGTAQALIDLIKTKNEAK